MVVLMSCNNSMSQTDCVANETSLCLNNDRFMVEVLWRDEVGNAFTIDNLNQTGNGQANSISEDTGTFWLFSDRHHEFLVKVLDGCAVNGHYWFFSAATTNVEYSLKVTDTGSGQVKVYSNPYETASPVITDVVAFATCPSNKSTTTLVDKNNAITKFEADQVITHTGQASCQADANTLCLHNNRFSVKVDWLDFQSNSGLGTASNLSDESGHFWFFSENNLEFIVNIYDGSATNGNYWVYASAITNVEYTLTVTDTDTGQIKQYFNPIGSTSTILDNRAFGLDPLSGPELPCADCQTISKLEVPTTGFWYNPEQSGSGFSLEVKNKTVFGAYYGYDDDGQPLWYTFLGQLQASQNPNSMWELNADLLEFEGGNSFNNIYSAPTLQEVKHNIHIVFNHLNHAEFSVDSGDYQNIVPLSYGLSHQRYFPDQTSIAIPDLEGYWVYSFRANTEDIDFNPFIYALQVPYMVYLGEPELLEFQDQTRQVIFKAYQLQGAPEYREEIGQVQCFTFIENNSIQGPKCSFTTNIGAAGNVTTTIEYFMPIAGLGNKKIFGESEAGDVFKAFRYDHCEFQIDNPDYHCEEF